METHTPTPPCAGTSSPIRHGRLGASVISYRVVPKGAIDGNTKPYAAYAVQCATTNPHGCLRWWTIEKRFSDFLTLHARLVAQQKDAAKDGTKNRATLPSPPAKVYSLFASTSTSRKVMMQRLETLSDYLAAVLEVQDRLPDLTPIEEFLEVGLQMTSPVPVPGPAPGDSSPAMNEAGFILSPLRVVRVQARALTITLDDEGLSESGHPWDEISPVVSETPVAFLEEQTIDSVNETSPIHQDDEGEDCRDTCAREYSAAPLDRSPSGGVQAVTVGALGGEAATLVDVDECTTAGDARPNSSNCVESEIAAYSQDVSCEDSATEDEAAEEGDENPPAFSSQYPASNGLSIQQEVSGVQAWDSAPALATPDVETGAHTPEGADGELLVAAAAPVPASVSGAEQGPEAPGDEENENVETDENPSLGPSCFESPKTPRVKPMTVNHDVLSNLRNVLGSITISNVNVGGAAAAAPGQALGLQKTRTPFSSRTPTRSTNPDGTPGRRRRNVSADLRNAIPSPVRRGTGTPNRASTAASAAGASLGDPDSAVEANVATSGANPAEGSGSSAARGDGHPEHPEIVTASSGALATPRSSNRPPRVPPKARMSPLHAAGSIAPKTSGYTLSSAPWLPAQSSDFIDVSVGLDTASVGVSPGLSKLAESEQKETSPSDEGIEAVDEDPSGPQRMAPLSPISEQHAQEEGIRPVIQLAAGSDGRIKLSHDSTFALRKSVVEENDVDVSIDAFVDMDESDDEDVDIARTRNTRLASRVGCCAGGPSACSVM